MRVEANVSQAELADQMGITQGMLSNLEHAKTRMDITYVLDYLDGIGTDPVRVMTEFLNAIEWGKPVRNMRIGPRLSARIQVRPTSVTNSSVR